MPMDESGKKPHEGPEKAMSSAGQYSYEYPRPMVTVDAAVFALRAAQWSLLLIQRKNPPFAGQWALPGGFVDMDEPLETAVARELAEETGLVDVPLEQLRAFGNPGRDPRGRNICVAYAGILTDDRQTPQGSDDAAAAQWFPLEALPELAFDHRDIVEYAERWLREKPRSGQ